MFLKRTKLEVLNMFKISGIGGISDCEGEEESKALYQEQRKAAEEGCAESQHYVGLRLLKGKGVPISVKEAFFWIEKAAYGGYVPAQRYLAFSYKEGGKLTEKNAEKAFFWTMKVAEQDDDDRVAKLDLAHMFLTGYGVKNNKEKALYWAIKGACIDAKRLYCANVLGHFGEMLLHGTEGVEQDELYAVRFFEEEATRDNWLTQKKLGDLYLEGFGRIKKDEKKAYFWYRKAAEQGFADAQCYVGQMLLNGVGTEQNVQEALGWLRKAANKGHGPAKYFIACIYRGGLGGIRKDKKAAFSLNMEAAEQGFVDAQYSVGQMLFNGVGTEQNVLKAFVWLRDAADEDHALAQHLLARIYREGLGGIEPDYGAALFWDKKAAEQGLVDAQCSYGAMLFDKNGPEAISWIERAANRGHALAQYTLAFAYQNGLGGLIENQELAALWYERAAKQGLVDAKYSLAVMLLNGIGIGKDVPRALYLLREAANKGHASARYDLAYHSGTKQDYDAALSFYKEAAGKGNTDAQERLGRLIMMPYACRKWRWHDYGEVEKDAKQARYWFGKAANKGCIPAKVGLAELFCHGIVTNGKEEALRWLREIAGLQGDDYVDYANFVHHAQKRIVDILLDLVGRTTATVSIREPVLDAMKEGGYLKACHLIAEMYEKGNRLPKNLKAALKWYERAGKEGYVYSQVRLGYIFSDDKMGKKNLHDAFVWFQRAADRNDPNAEFEIGMICISSPKPPLRDLEKGVWWLGKAAVNGSFLAQNKLGDLYRKGYGVKKDVEKAARYYQGAAKQSCGVAKYNLAVMLANGIGIKENKKEAVKLYQEAAFRHDILAAKHNLAVCYERGRLGIAPDEKRAFELYQDLAQKGFVFSQYNLANMYREGRVVEQSYQKALSLYQKAAKVLGIASYQIGLMFEYGLGVEKDAKKAMKWYIKANRQGCKEAREKLLVVGGLLSVPLSCFFPANNNAESTNNEGGRMAVAKVGDVVSNDKGNSL